MHNFSHIDAFYQVVRYLDALNASVECPEKNKIRGAVKYRGSVKLHGANAAVACSATELVAQSRSRVITPSDDNYGFAAFVAEAANAEAIRQIETSVRQGHGVSPEATVVLYGEWVGPGLQKGVAINQLAHRQWVLFAIKVVLGEESRYLDALPMFGHSNASAGIHSISDGPLFEIEVDFGLGASKQAALEEADRITRDVDARCPWAARFGVEGPGEGVVWVPVGDHWGNPDLFFKTKGEKHKNTRVRGDKPQLAPEVLEGIEAFVAFAVTDNRLQQGLEAVAEMGHALDMRSMIHFLKWIGQDVKRECDAELETNQLEWKDVSKVVTQRARDFFCKEIARLAMQ